LTVDYFVEVRPITTAEIQQSNIPQPDSHAGAVASGQGSSEEESK